MLWAALRLPAEATAPPTEALTGLSLWAVQFTPRVALRDEAVVMELTSSVRLFGGKRALCDCITAESRELGAVAWHGRPTAWPGCPWHVLGSRAGFVRD